MILKRMILSEIHFLLILSEIYQKMRTRKINLVLVLNFLAEKIKDFAVLYSCELFALVREL